MKIIAFGHRKLVGKDTAARFLTTELRLANHNLNIKQVGFADKVKDVAYQLFGWAGLMPGYYYEDEKCSELKDIPLKAIGKSPRQLWIGVGNGVRTATGYDGVWLDYLFKHIQCDIMVIKDLRFPAEADGVLKEGGYLFKIDCSWRAKVTDGADEPLENYDKWTEIINNDHIGNQQHLYNQVKQLIKKYNL